MPNQLSLNLGAQLIQAHSEGTCIASYTSLIQLFISVLETLEYDEDEILEILKETLEMMYIDGISKELGVVIEDF